MFNKVLLMGRLTKDVEMRQAADGHSVARFTLAVNRRFKKNEADFINCAAWNKTAQFIQKWFVKGSMIAVIGSIQSRSWDGQDGKKQYATEVIVDEAYFTGKRPGQDNTYSQTPPSQNYSQQPKQEHMFDDDFYSGFSDIDGSEEDLPF